MLPILALGTTTFALLQAIFLATSPNLLVFLLATSARESTEVEKFLCRAAAAGLLTLAGLSFYIPRLALDADDGSLTMVTLSLTVYHVLTAILAYLWYMSPDYGTSLHGLVVLASAVLAAAGVGVLIFGQEASTKGSGWMFPNQAKIARKAEKRSKRGLA